VNVLKTVVLAEKPSQAKAYSQAFEIAKREKTHIELKPCSSFPNGATITWGIGHLVSLKMPNDYKEEWKKWDLKNLLIIPERFEFKVSEDKKTQFNAVKKLFNEAHLLVNACDIDREGSNIFYSIYNMTGARNKTIKRLWINSLEEDEVRKGFNNLHDNKKDLMMYSEARGRQIGDWLVGINASQIFTLLLAEKGIRETISAGRVSSPTVYMIYQRQKKLRTLYQNHSLNYLVNLK
jgi:DNA topoisomerase-3